MKRKLLQIITISSIALLALTGCSPRRSTAMERITVIDSRIPPEQANSSSDTNTNITTSQNDNSSQLQTFVPALSSNTSANLLIVGSFENFESLEAVLDDFTDIYPNIHVSYEKLDNYEGNICTRLQNDTSVALFMNTPERMCNIEELSYLTVNLNTINYDLSQLDSNVKKLCSDQHGKIYFLPFWYTYDGFIVNKTLLEKYNKAVPTNYEELLSVCETFKREGIVPIQGHSDNYKHLSLAPDMYTLSGLTQIKQHLIIEGAEGSANDLASSTEKIFYLRDKHYVADDVNDNYPDSYNAAILSFFNGDVPFLCTDSTTVTGMAKRETKSQAYTDNPFEYVFIPSPLGDNGPIKYVSVFDACSISSNCNYPEIAEELFRFIFSKEELTKMAEIKHAPNITGSDTLDIYKAFDEVDNSSTVIMPYYLSEHFAEASMSKCDYIVNYRLKDVDAANRYLEEYLSKFLE